LKVAIDQGLRAQLRSESLLTGVLYIGIDLFPGTPVKFVQAAGSKYPEIPAVPTTLERAEVTASEIFAKLSEVDFKGMTDSVSRAVDGVGQLVNSPALNSALQRLDQTMPKIDQAIVEIRKMTSNLDGNITTLSTNLEQTSDAARGAMQQAALTLKQTDAALKEAEAAMINIRGISDPDSVTFYELGRSLREVSAAARSLRLLSDSVQRNPRSLIFGKPEMQEGK
jgi:paraquat-inducible protein B